MKSDHLASRRIVLLGIGHTNAHVVRMWGKSPLPDTELVCVSNHSVATYSGMLPAVLAGQHPEHAMQIDLVRLCSSVGARLIVGNPIGLDRERRALLFGDRPALSFDVLSIGVGSVPSTAGVEVDDALVLSTKPMQTFLSRLRSRVQVLAQEKSQEPINVTVVGGGAASVELAFCLHEFLRQTHSSARFKLRLITRDDRVGSGFSDGVTKRIDRELMAREIEVISNAAVVLASGRRVVTDDRTLLQTDLAIWATGAAPSPLLQKLDLPRDRRGFLATEPSLRSQSGDPIFAVGDTGSIVGESLPKSGVYAVRQGPVLWRNLRNQILDRPLEAFRPQRGFLKLLNLGNGQAIGQWRGFHFQGHWAYRLKNYIDQQFLRQFQPGNMSATKTETMQCRGCGCKLDGRVLARSLDFIQIASGESLRDDAAYIGDQGNEQLVSSDFFSLPLDDVYLSGRVTALHCSSDLLACGTKVEHAIANVVVPEGDPASQERWLQEFMAGAKNEFAMMSARIVGGHTIVGPRAEAGFTVMAKPTERMWTKRGLQIGDQLVLTKPLGVGVLLAAHAQNACEAADYQAAVTCMLHNQFRLAEQLASQNIQAATDVTGFGLAGHLLEMLHASQVGARLSLDRLPLLSGATKAIRAGLRSSMAAANKRIESQIQREVDIHRVESEYAVLQNAEAYELMFDPQTCGGLLIGIPEKQLDSLLRACQSAGVDDAVRIGEVIAYRSGKRLLVW